MIASHHHDTHEYKSPGSEGVKLFHGLYNPIGFIADKAYNWLPFMDICPDQSDG